MYKCTLQYSPQVYAIKDVPASLLIQLAVLLSSPLLFLLSNTGAVLGSLTALTFLPPADYQQVLSTSLPPNTAVALSFAARGRSVFVLLWLSLGCRKSVAC